jgi:fucose permease
LSASPFEARSLRLAKAAVYAGALVQGLTLVSFPASSAILKHAHGFSDAEYGAIFLPQVVMVIGGSIAGGFLAGRLGLRRLLALAFGVNLVSQAALAASVAFQPDAAYASILLGTTCLGLGFGLSAAPLNTYPALLFPKRRDAAIVAMHTAMGAGLAAGPLLAGFSSTAGTWVAFPALLATLCLLLAGASLVVALPKAETSVSDGVVAERRPVGEIAFWLFVATVVLYAIGEGTFGNWALLYLSEERGLAPAAAALALSAFWGALTGGRVVVSLLLLRVPARPIWASAPLLMISAFLIVPLVRTANGGALAFAWAGLACAACFPLTLSLATRRYATHGPWIASMMMAAVMSGVGFSSLAIGPLRAHIALARLYPLSALWPLLTLGAIVLLIRRGDA